MKTTPDVFIIESLRFSDEENQHSEGAFISHILKLAERQVRYYYIRTRSELEAVLHRFEASRFRYLHISCHANRDGLALTLDDLDIAELGDLVNPYLDNRRIFFSACQLATPQLAQVLLKNTGCYSVIGPSNKVRFDEAALFWASLYHLMFRNDETVMKKGDLRRNLQALSTVFGVNARYFSKAQNLKGFTEVSVQT